MRVDFGMEIQHSSARGTFILKVSKVSGDARIKQTRPNGAARTLGPELYLFSSDTHAPRYM
jgi:hypothetical protein